MKLTELTFPIPYNPVWEITDATKLKAFLECPRAYFFEYVLGWRSANPNIHLVFGQAIHEAMDYLYTAKDFSPSAQHVAYEKFEKVYRAVFPPGMDQFQKSKVPERVKPFLAEYCLKYATDLRRYEILHVETPVKILLGKDFVLYGKLDTIMRDLATKQIVSLEHKTASGYLNENWIKTHRNSIQVFTYTHALYCLFGLDAVDCVIINGCSFKITKSIMFDLQRFPLKKYPENMRIWQMHTIDWLESLAFEFSRLAETKDSDEVMTAFPCRWPNCGNWAGCKYEDLCQLWKNPIQKLSAMPDNLTVDHWNPMETFKKEPKEVG